MSLLTVAICSSHAWAQTGTKGQNDVWKGSSPVQVGSSAFIDASMFAIYSDSKPTTDLCAEINLALAAFDTEGIVIDARGININNSLADSSSNMQCNGDTPWIYNGSNITVPSVILLPAGAIDITTTWVLPDRTRIFGEGMNSYGNTPGQSNMTQGAGTSIAWTGTSAGPMIQFGAASPVCPTVNSAPVCTGVSIQDVFLFGNYADIVGIENLYAQELSYVDHVNFKYIAGTGLLVSANATGSGPYSNLACTAQIKASTAPTMTCVDLEASNTLGLHGVTAIDGGNPNGTSVTANAGIYVDGSNNTIEDIHTEAFVDGVEVGANFLDVSSPPPVEGVVLLDINAGDGAGAVTNAIHICGSDLPAGGAACATQTHGLSAVSDLSVVGALTDNGIEGGSIATLQDDVTGTWLEQPTGTNVSSVAAYLLGDPVAIGSATAYSRLTTSTFDTSPQITPTWMVGSGSVGTTTCSAGSFYSDIKTTDNITLYVCVGGTTWTGVK